MRKLFKIIDKISQLKISKPNEKMNVPFLKITKKWSENPEIYTHI